MSENVNEKKNMSTNVHIADEVIAIIAATAAMEVPGVVSSQSAPSNALVEFFGKKSQSKGVKIEVNEGNVTIDMEVAVLFGAKIQEVALKVQSRVKTEVETMTGLNVLCVNVNVTGIMLENKKNKDSEEE